MTDREILEKLFYVVTGVKDDVSSLKSDVSSLKSEMNEVHEEISALKSDVNTLNVKVDTLSTDLNSMKLTIENEIRPNIKEIAACHLDLSKKLDAVTASYESYSDLQIRVRVLESQMREVRMAQ